MISPMIPLTSILIATVSGLYFIDMYCVDGNFGDAIIGALFLLVGMVQLSEFLH